MKSRNAASSSTTKMRGMGRTPDPLMMQINEGARKSVARFGPRTSEAQFSRTGEFANPGPIGPNADRSGSVWVRGPLLVSAGAGGDTRPSVVAPISRGVGVAQSGPAPIASEALTRIAALYRIEADIRGRSADERRAIRRERSRPLVEALQPWLREKLSLISQKTKLAEAIHYAPSRWAGLCLFLQDGRIEIDNNAVDRAIRPLALNRKNALFAGSDGGAEHWAWIA